MDLGQCTAVEAKKNNKKLTVVHIKTGRQKVERYMLCRRKRMLMMPSPNGDVFNSNGDISYIIKPQNSL